MTAQWLHLLTKIMDEIEIPEAIRESTEISEKSRSISLPLIIGVILCLGIAGLSSVYLFIYANKSADEPAAEPPTAKSASQPTVQQSQPNLPDAATSIGVASESATQSIERGLLGHLPYNVVPESDLVAIDGNENLRMRPAAAKKFQQMQAAARADGIDLVLLSAFRDLQAQDRLFFGVKEQRSQDATKRAEVSAPPGYSEHHTGYAIDLGDGNAPATHLEVEFADTAAFRWLQQNALKYSFELSFPPNNQQGVSYEPWHWRYVGDRDSLETFYKDKVRN